MAEQERSLRELVAEVAVAYFSKSPVNVAEIPEAISAITASLTSVSAAEPKSVVEGRAPVAGLPTTAQILRSITLGGLVSFEDGKSYQMLRRHLSKRGLTPKQYRLKWGLPPDYPMVSQAYLAKRAAAGPPFAQAANERGRREA